MVARMTRSSVLDVLREDYSAHRASQGRGRATGGGQARPAQRGHSHPHATGLQAGQLMGGAVLTETGVRLARLGRLMVKAIFARDYVLLQGAVAFIFASPSWSSTSGWTRPTERLDRDRRGRA